MGLSYLTSAALLRRIRAEEPPPPRREGARLRAQVAEGLRFVFGNPALRAITLCTASGNLASGVFAAVEMLLLTRHVSLGPAGVGVVLAVGGTGGVLGALTAGRWTRKAGQARTVWLVPLVTWPAQLLVPLAAPGWRVMLAGAGLAVVGYGIVVYNVAQVSYRQAVCPDRLLGRMNASVRFVVWGSMPIGALAGGALGELIGVPATAWTAAAALPLTALWVVFSPLRALRDMPVPAS